ncbi:M20 family metallopeptidase [Croceicoccus sediminis]|uniref:M20 family metallopeptidase n=1 Tax=Croceicoccus sediminis TaxID=2571150 RepID=UPI001183869E|nr:deacylase [Croceicoccus sediminis]
MDRIAGQEPLMLTEIQRGHYEKAIALATPDALAEAAAFLVDIPSPTGDEAPLAEAVAARLRNAGIDGQTQYLDERQANAFAVMHGSGGRPSLMLYAPTDTVTSNSEEEDLPWAGAELYPEMRAKAHIDGDVVSGLGAQNPKGHGACAMVAVEAIRRAGVPLAGDLMLGLGAGGMPTNARSGARADSGHGVGCDHMMKLGPRPDCAIIAKSGWAVSWEEVGLAWYEVEIEGGHTYVGSRHLISPFSNAIANAAKVVLDLEEWFPQWAEQHRSGLVAPQGVVSFIEGGWERMPAFTPAVCRLRFDLRLSPRTSAAEADAAVDAILTEIGARHGVTTRWKRIVTIPGTTTDPEEPIIQRCIEAWEFLEGREHVPMYGMSGATDANILRGHGVPTARIGLPKLKREGIDFQQGMNMVSIADMVRLTRHLILVAVATCCD